jgi:tetratricopeptide (TPR) repeat protein
MALSNDIIELIKAAQGERNAARSEEFLETALAKCEEWEASDGMPDAALLKSQVLALLAYEQNSPKERSMFWKRSLKTLTSAIRNFPQPSLAEVLGSLAVDFFQDAYSDDDFGSRLRTLREARDQIDVIIKSGVTDAWKGGLLARKASILRHLSIGDASELHRIRRLDESVSCAALAMKLSSSSFALLELGLSRWARSRYEASDESYVNQLREVEFLLTDDRLKNSEVGQMALARFYRMTYRPADACRVFCDFSNDSSNTRRLLREAYIYGEASVQLWYAKYPEEVVRQHLTTARALLEHGLSAGYMDARSITTLSDIVAILDGTAAANKVLGELSSDRQDISWQAALNLVAEASRNDLIAFGFALGIDQSAVWSHIGTFAYKFLGDTTLAAALYREAIRIDSHSAIAHTNLARLLVRLGGTDALLEAGRHLQQAQTFADRRFTWWRQVLNELKNAEAKPSEVKATQPKANAPSSSSPKPARATMLKQIRKRFHRLENLTDVQMRGKGLEGLFDDLAALTFGLAAGSYLLKRSGGHSQIDGYFEVLPSGQPYRVECKWETRVTDHTDIVLFKDKLDVAGGSGLFISMSGFTESAIGRAREFSRERAILLMDGKEASAIFLGELNLDEAIRQKRLHFDKESNPYFRVVTSIETSA